MNEAAIHVLRFSGVVLLLIAGVVFMIGGFWALAFMLFVLAAIFGLDAVMRVMRRDLDVAMKKMRPVDRLLYRLDNPDPVKLAFGQFLVFGIIVAVAIDRGSVPVWAVISVLAFQTIWITTIVVRRRRRNQPSGDGQVLDRK